MTETTPQTDVLSSRQAFERDVLARASADAAFRAALLTDTRAAIKNAYDLELPPSIDLRVVEETPSTFYLVLPAQTAVLTDEQLAAVAGGAAGAGIFPNVVFGATFDKDHAASFAGKASPLGPSFASSLPGLRKF
jgi:hypothetical protein